SRNVLAVAVAGGAAAEESGWEVMAATDRGLDVRSRDGSWDLYFGCGPIGNRITTVAVTAPQDEEEESIAWFGFGRDAQPLPGGGVSRFDPATPDRAGAGGWWHLLGEANVRALATAPDGSLWAAAGCRVYHLAPSVAPDALLSEPVSSWSLVADCDAFQGNVLDFAFEPGGAAWVATGFGLARFDGEAWQTYDRLAYTVAVGPGDAVWVSGWQGTQGAEYVARFDGEAWTEVSDRSLQLLEATGGEIWGRAGEQGVARFDGDEWTFYDAVDGRSLASGSALAAGPPSPDGTGPTVWVAGAGALFHFDGGSWTVYDLPALVADSSITDMAVAVDGAVWLATSHGALRFEPGGE
ncbi:MAG: hypothetical protein PVG11_04740, partial [Anaerolineae bacterium]